MYDWNKRINIWLRYEAPGRPPSISEGVHTGTSSLTLYERLTVGRDASVWRGRWTREELPLVEVVVKISDLDRRFAERTIKQEAEIYSSRLGTVQGKVVPWFYGFYTGETQAEVPVACILLENWDNPMFDLTLAASHPDWPDWKHR